MIVNDKITELETILKLKQAKIIEINKKITKPNKRLAVKEVDLHEIWKEYANSKNTNLVELINSISPYKRKEKTLEFKIEILNKLITTKLKKL